MSANRVHTQPRPATTGNVCPTPLAPFAEWLNYALERVPVANAMNLATASLDGQTSLRTVLLKAYSDDGFVFFTGPETLKVRQMTENPRVSLLFFWPELNRQVRIDGTASRIAITALARSFFSKGVNQGVVTWVSPHGRVADARQAFEGKMHEMLRVFRRDADKEPEGVPSSVCSFLVSPITVQFWQGGAGVQHASLDYLRSADGWSRRVSGTVSGQPLGLPLMADPA